jgi:hypothetical protein
MVQVQKGREINVSKIVVKKVTVSPLYQDFLLYIIAVV